MYPKVLFINVVQQNSLFDSRNITSAPHTGDVKETLVDGKCPH